MQYLKAMEGDNKTPTRMIWKNCCEFIPVGCYIDDMLNSLPTNVINIIFTTETTSFGWKDRLH